MKKLLAIIFTLVFIQTQILAIEQVATIKPYYDETIENQITDLTNQIPQALAQGNYKLLSEIFEIAYNREKTGNPESIKLYNDLFSAYAIQTNLAEFELTQNKKYAEKAYEWSKQAIDDNTNQIYAIQANILMASSKPNLKQMTKAFELYRKINLKEAMEFYPQYQTLYDKAVEIKQQKNETRKAKFKNILYVTLMGISAGASSYGQSMQNYYNNQNIQNRGSSSTNCYNMGNSIQCNTTNYSF